MTTWKHKKDPWMPADWDDFVVYSVRACFNGDASQGQQKQTMRWIQYLTGVGEFQDMSYRPGVTGDRDTAFAEGKRFVGLQLLKMLHEDTTPKAKTEEKK